MRNLWPTLRKREVKSGGGEEKEKGKEKPKKKTVNRIRMIAAGMEW